MCWKLEVRSHKASPCRAPRRVKRISIETLTLQLWLLRHAKDLDRTQTKMKYQKVLDLSPFAIGRSIQLIAGHPKSIKRLKLGGLLLEVEKKSHTENLLKTKNLFNLNVKISLHGSLNPPMVSSGVKI